MRASLSDLSISAELSPLHRVLICGTYVLPQLRQFWTDIRTELADEHPYRASIGGMWMRLSELQESDTEVRKIRAEGLDGYEEIDGVRHHQGLPFAPEVIRTELISRHYDDPLAGHFGIDKTRELIGRNYYWPSLRRNVEAYVKGCDVCLASKADLSMDFVTGLSVSTDWKGESYASILVIVDRLTKTMEARCSPRNSGHRSATSSA